jgi:hypothetical protein
MEGLLYEILELFCLFKNYSMYKFFYTFNMFKLHALIMT